MALTKVKLIADGVITSANLDASHGITTSNIGEGSNLYYTDARVSSYLSTNGFATQTDIVAAITDSAPVTLDTLNELAAALGDDPNFATTTATSIGTKMPLAGGTFTGNVTFSSTTTFNDDITLNVAKLLKSSNNPASNFLDFDDDSTTHNPDGNVTTLASVSGIALATNLNDGGGGNFTISTGSTGTELLRITTAGDAAFAGIITVNGGGIDIDNNDDVRLRFDNASVFKAGLQVVTTAGDMIAGSAVNDFAIRAQENMLFATGGNTERMRIDSSGNIRFTGTAPNSGDEITQLNFYNTTSSINLARITGIRQAGGSNYGALTFSTTNSGTISEKMRIDSSGNVGINQTNPNDLSNGATTLHITGTVTSKAGGIRLDSSDASVLCYIYPDSVNGISIGSLSNHNYRVVTNGSERMRIDSIGIIFFGDVAEAVPSAATSIIRFIPAADTTVDLGSSSRRWEEVFSVQSSINTSDENEKQQIESLDEVELRVAQRIKGLIRKFKWNSAVENKGDNARIHFGVIAQDLQRAFEAEGLNAEKYGLFCSDTWWEEEVTETDEEGNEKTKIKTYEEYKEGTIEKTRLGVRYTELLAFVIAAL